MHPKQCLAYGKVGAKATIIVHTRTVIRTDSCVNWISGYHKLCASTVFKIKKTYT